VHLQGVTDSTALCVHLTKLESHISDASFVCNHSCFFIRIKAAKEETSSGMACLLSWDHEVNCPSIEQDRPRDTSEPEGKVASLPSVAQQNAWTDHMFHQYTVQNACGTKRMGYKMHAVQNACGTKLHGSMLLTWAKNLLAAAAHDSWLVLKAHLNPKCINHNPKYSSPGALTCLCCLHGLLALLLNKFTKISRLPYLFFVVRKIWKVDRV